MLSFIHKLFPIKVPRPTTARGFQPQLDHLENRLVPTGLATINGNLYIYGSESKDDVYIKSVGYNSIQLWLNGHYSEHYVPGGQVVFYGGGGSDRFENNSPLTSTAYGGAGADTLIGGHGIDYLYGQNGTDYLYGRGGNDVLDGGWDDKFNHIEGGDGDDYLYGALGADHMHGEAGTDVLRGRDGNDTLRGGSGMDYLYGENGNDLLDGGQDGYGDYLNGGAGSDFFVREWAYYYAVTRNGGSGYWYDRESVADYNAYQDTFIS